MNLKQQFKTFEANLELIGKLNDQAIVSAEKSFVGKKVNLCEELCIEYEIKPSEIGTIVNVEVYDFDTISITVEMDDYEIDDLDLEHIIFLDDKK